MMTNPLLDNTNSKTNNNTDSKTNSKTNGKTNSKTNSKNTNIYVKVSDSKDTNTKITYDTDNSNNSLEECIICFEYITNTDKYYFCKRCSVPVHKKCCQEWWLNQHKKRGQCVHCQTKKDLVLLKPHTKRTDGYGYFFYILRKLGCYF